MMFIRVYYKLRESTLKLMAEYIDLYSAICDINSVPIVVKSVRYLLFWK